MVSVISSRITSYNVCYTKLLRVSHELKTPLTSIRMYGEILQEGWADEHKKKDYYGYIHDEGERLSRLIDNVLQLARMTRNELRANLKPLPRNNFV